MLGTSGLDEMGISDKLGTYAVRGTENASSESVPSLAPGLGTRIRAAADALGTRENAAKLAGVSADMLQKYFREASTPAFDVAARLCLAAGMNVHWLATGKEPPAAQSQPVRLDPAALRGAVEAVDAALDIAGVEVQSADRAELYVRAYDLMAEATSVPQATAQVLRLIMGGKR